MYVVAHWVPGLAALARDDKTKSRIGVFGKPLLALRVRARFAAQFDSGQVIADLEE